MGKVEAASGHTLETEQCVHGNPGMLAIDERLQLRAKMDDGFLAWFVEQDERTIRGAGREILELHTGLFFAIVILRGLFIDDFAEGSSGGDEPFFTVGIVAAFADGIVGHQEVYKIFGAAVAELVGFAGLEEEGVAGGDFGEAVFITDGAGAGEDEVEFPLGGVEVVGAVGGAGREAVPFQIERMSLEEVGGLGLPAEGFGEAFVEGVIFALG